MHTSLSIYNLNICDNNNQIKRDYQLEERMWKEFKLRGTEEWEMM